MLSSLLLIILISIYGNFSNGGISFSNTNFNNNIAQVVFSIVLIINLLGLFPRFISKKMNSEKNEILKKIIRSKYKMIISLIFILLLILTIFSFIILKLEQDYYLNNPNESAGKEINNIWISLWYCFVTITTIGFGDFVPFSVSAKIVTVVMSLVGVTFYGFVGGIAINTYSEYSISKKNIDDEVNELNKQNALVDTIVVKVADSILINLTEAGIITKKKYDELTNKNLENLLCDEAQEIIDNFEIDIKTKKIKIGNTILGMKEDNLEIVEKTRIAKYTKVEDEKFNNKIKYTILYKVNAGRISKLLNTQSFSVFCTKKFNSDIKLSEIILFKSNIGKEAVCSLKIYKSINISKKMAWEQFNKNMEISKKDFNLIFSREKEITIHLVSKVYEFSKPRILEK